MKPQKYKTTKFYGLEPVGTMIDCFVLNIDNDTGEALVYLPPTRTGQVGCFEFCKALVNKTNKTGTFWVTSNKTTYVNMGACDKDFKKFLKSIKP